MSQQTSLLDRLLEQPLTVLVAGTLLGMYVIGTLEERKARRDKEKEEPSHVAPPFISEADKELWEKFRRLYRQEMGNSDKNVNERIELLNENVTRLQNHIEELLDRTQPAGADEESKDAQNAK
jgi:hypothetical protein